MNRIKASSLGGAFGVVISLGAPYVQASLVCNDPTSAVCQYLQPLYDSGMAAGNAGDYYQNNDGGHANVGNFYSPQVTILPQQNIGPSTTVDSTKVIVGNASQIFYLDGIDRIFSVSFPRYLTSSQGLADAIYQQYTHNNAYWHPANHDHDAQDLFQTMNPAINASQGASGSENMDVVRTFWTLAAFKPATKAALKAAGLLMPTIEMIMRRMRVASDAEYLSPIAHANAWDELNTGTWAQDYPLGMVQMAQGMLATEVPPMVQLRTLSDTFTPVPGNQFFDIASPQQLYDTPVSIARIWRTFEYTESITVTAQDSYDLNHRGLTYTWVVLRGDPAHVRITALAPDQSTVKIDVDYPDPLVTPVNRVNWGPTILSNIVVVGAFVRNGVYYSAPGFVTVYGLPGEKRTYDPSTHLLQQIDYSDTTTMYSIAHPKNWDSDTFHYDTSNHWTGFSRIDKPWLPVNEFTPEGYLVLARDSFGCPIRVQNVMYMAPLIPGLDRTTWQATGAPFVYAGCTADTVAPTAPIAQPLSNPTNTTLMLSWSASSDAVGVAGYRFQVATDAAFTNVLPSYADADAGNVLSVPITGLNASTLYYARVRAYDAVPNVSAYSNIVQGQTTGTVPVTPIPTTLVVSPLTVVVQTGASQTFSGVVNDQGGQPMLSIVNLNWSVSAGGGTIDNTGKFIASSVPGTYTVSATEPLSGIVGTAQVTIPAGPAPIPPPQNPTGLESNASTLRVYPNPWQKDRDAGTWVTFEGLSAGTTLKIFTISAHLVKEIHTDGPTYVWKLTNEHGEPVASGLYLYVMTNSRGDKTRGKLAVIR